MTFATVQKSIILIGNGEGVDNRSLDTHKMCTYASRNQISVLNDATSVATLFELF